MALPEIKLQLISKSGWAKQIISWIIYGFLPVFYCNTRHFSQHLKMTYRQSYQHHTSVTLHLNVCICREQTFWLGISCSAKHTPMNWWSNGVQPRAQGAGQSCCSWHDTTKVDSLNKLQPLPLYNTDKCNIGPSISNSSKSSSETIK